MVIKLKLGPLVDDKPVKLTVELPAQVHRDLVAYAEVLASENGRAVDAAKLVAPMLARFMATDRAFAKARSVAMKRASIGATNLAASTGRQRLCVSGEIAMHRGRQLDR